MGPMFNTIMAIGAMGLLVVLHWRGGVVVAVAGLWQKAWR